MTAAVQAITERTRAMEVQTDQLKKELLDHFRAIADADAKALEIARTTLGEQNGYGHRNT